jgi:hypothetical protein
MSDIRPTWTSDCGTVQLYLGDCLEVLPTLAPVDFVLTDPPWIARADKITRRSKGVAPVVVPSTGIGYGTIGSFSTDSLRIAWSLTKNDMFVICGYRELGHVIQVLEPIRGVFVWHKPNGGISVVYPCPLDVAYVVWGAKTSKITGFQHWRSGVMSHAIPTAGCISNGERILTERNGPALHPAQGPVSLYAQLCVPLDGTILDPYMGTGTSGVAAVRRGNWFTGIEINECYFEIAKKRIKDELRRVAFLEPKPRETQRTLLEAT